MSRAEDLDPLSVPLKANYCGMLRLARRLDQAIAKCNEALELAPDFGWALETTGEVYEDKGEYSEAHKFWSKAGHNATTIGVWDEIHKVPGVKGTFDAWLKNQKRPAKCLISFRCLCEFGQKRPGF